MELVKLIINTSNPNYENQNIPITSNYAFPAVKYFYPQRYGYQTANVQYPVSSPTYEQSPVPSTGLESLLYQRQEVIQAKIQMVLSEINQRRILKDENLSQIDLDQNTCRNIIYRMRRYYVDRQRVDMEKKIIDLEEEKRREKTTYFRDILFLRKELRESFVEKLEEDQKAELFTN